MERCYIYDAVVYRNNKRCIYIYTLEVYTTYNKVNVVTYLSINGLYSLVYLQQTILSMHSMCWRKKSQLGIHRIT
jgi:hypothetical protein